ncbi:MAG: acetate kinase [Eubacteriales bacterium]|nr:acetate kinase [Eubacteriales bacterium]
MYILVVNAGSSSLKYQLFDMDTKAVMAKGLCECIGIPGGRMKHEALGKLYEVKVDIPTHAEATKMVVEALVNRDYGCIKSMDQISAVGHRIVQGGPWLVESVLVDDDVIKKLERCKDLAPLHTVPHLLGIRGCMAVMPSTPQVLVIDTAFHQTMPEKAYIYPIPYELYEKYSIRRYGFHGTSHRYVSGKCIEYLGGKAEGTKIITCHLGNGSSIAAIKDGKVIDTSMGFTPLDGIIMGSRCGGVDPAIIPFIMEKENIAPKDMQSWMNKKCGLLGVSGVSSDLRELTAAKDSGNERAVLAYDILVYDIKKYIGAYAASLNGVDAIVFTAGIGENNPQVRADVCADMDYMGVKIDPEKNAVGKRLPEPAIISTPDSKVKVFVIMTDEELVIATDTEAVVKMKN